MMIPLTAWNVLDVFVYAAVAGFAWSLGCWVFGRAVGTMGSRQP